MQSLNHWGFKLEILLADILLPLKVDPLKGG